MVGDIPNDEIMDIVDKGCNAAIELAKLFNRILDYSAESIDYVEEILDGYSKRARRFIIGKIKYKDSDIAALATCWGIYVGEIMRRKLGDKCVWVYEDAFGNGELLHIKYGEARAFPIAKAYKRIKNGPEDNVKSFYEILLIKMVE